MKTRYFAVIGSDTSDSLNYVSCDTLRMAQDVQTHGTIETEKPCTIADVMYSMAFAELGIFQVTSA